MKYSVIINNQSQLCSEDDNSFDKATGFVVHRNHLIPGYIKIQCNQVVGNQQDILGGKNSF